MGFGATNKTYVLGIDVGGSKIDAELFPVQNGTLADNPVWTKKEPARQGVANHTRQVANLVNDAAAWVEAKDATLAGVGIGSPGRFAPNGRIKPGTNPYLGDHDHSFDNVLLWGTYMVRITEKNPALEDIPLYVENDGQTMLRGMLDSIQKGKISGLKNQRGEDFSRYSLYNRYVGLIGIGTGIGHAIARVDTEGNPHFVTDGHASKLRIKVDDEDWHMVEKMKEHAGDLAFAIFDDHTARAEDLFRSRALHTMTHLPRHVRIDPNSAQNQEALRFAGKYMARTIEAIKSGESVDVHPPNGWSAQDKAEAAKTSIYLIGGGIGGGELGAKILHYAQQELGADNAAIQLVQVPGEFHARSAATLVPSSLYRKQPEVGL